MSEDRERLSGLQHSRPRQKARLRSLQQKAAGLAHAGRISEALEYQRQAVALAPLDPEAHMRLGYLHRSVYQIEEAVGSFLKASRLDPSTPDPHEALAEAYLDVARYDEAILQSKQLLRLEPKSLAARDILSTAYLQKGQVDKALGITSEMVHLAPLDALCHYKKGLLHRERCSWREALEAFTTAADISPEQSIERAEAEAAIEALDQQQIGEILLLASEDRLFQMRLSRGVQEAIQERGYHLTLEAQVFLQRIALDQMQDISIMEAGSFYAQGPRIRLYN